MTKLHILESLAILLRISEARLESNLVDTKENLYWMFRAVGRSKVNTIHTFESLADHMKISENIKYKTLSILQFRDNESNSLIVV